MPRLVAIFASLAIVLLGGTPLGSALADDTQSRSKAPPSDKEVADMVGCRMSKLFAKFHYPQAMFATEATSNNPKVFLDYGDYGFKISDKVVDSCMFFPGWKGTIFGAKMGDSTDEVVKKLGKPESTEKDDDGLPYMTWSFKEWDGSLEIDFDKNNKMDRAIVSVD
jgi:hypothetical protein